jgi:hypothetical protein
MKFAMSSFPSTPNCALREGEDSTACEKITSLTSSSLSCFLGWRRDANRPGSRLLLVTVTRCSDGDQCFRHESAEAPEQSDAGFWIFRKVIATDKFIVEAARKVETPKRFPRPPLPVLSTAFHLPIHSLFLFRSFLFMRRSNVHFVATCVVYHTVEEKLKLRPELRSPAAGENLAQPAYKPKYLLLSCS